MSDEIRMDFGLERREFVMFDIVYFRRCSGGSLSVVALYRYVWSASNEFDMVHWGERDKSISVCSLHIDLRVKSDGNGSVCDTDA